MNFPPVIYGWYRHIRLTLNQCRALDNFFQDTIGSPFHFRVLIVWNILYYPTRLKSTIRYMEYIAKLLRTRGVRTTIKHVKTIRNIVTRYFCGDPIFRSDRIRMIREGWPFALRFLWSPSVHTSLEDKKYILSLLVFLRGIKGRDAPSIDPIIAKYTGKDLEIQKGYIETVVGTIPKASKSLDFNRWHLTTKSGPYGHALSHLVDDFLSLSDEIKGWISTIGGEKYSSHMQRIARFLAPEQVEEIRHTFKQSSKEGQSFIGKLNMVPDSESKTRVIAQINYFIQAALRPLHEDTMRILKNIPNDLTFDQETAPTKLVKSPNSKYHSLDLSQATDRFPMEIQQHLLLLLYGKQISDVWGNIIRIPFYVDPKIGGNCGPYVRYSVGQPMGCYSSWSVFTLTHHCIVRYAMHKSICTNNNCYVILGDDIVIADDSVACIYKSVLESLGVEISSLKSHTSYHSYEIAKRWFCEDGNEYTPWSSHAIAACGKSPGLIIQALREQILKGWKSSKVSLPVITTILLSLYNTGHRVTPERYFRNLWRLSLWVYLIDKVLSGQRQISSLIRFISFCKGYRVEDTPTDVVVSEIHISLVQKMKNSVQALGKDLGSFISTDVKFIDTSPSYHFNDPNKPSSLIYWPSIEFIHYMREDVINKIGDAFNRKVTKSIEWKDMMRIIITPNLSKIMVARDSEVRGMVTSIFLRESIKTLADVNNNNGESLPPRAFGKVKFLARRTGEKYKFIN